ncbi:type III secretion system export apparatus subunit SctV [Edaphobacter modestus]|uniref:Type III secretion protein V n=1 Tax=Edaphobacter modestus TaxID=388466 RepID=A0A4Q7YYH5_9BACT|nr:type III secretion system export apparatus subunit SctV [Edaphobacter modestus]RZU42243.1 type III secretion protein V [Edaphobacter modestus]
MLKGILAQFEDVKTEVRGGNFSSVVTRFSDLLLVVCIVLIVGLMIVPLPTFLLDVFITANITIAITILMVALYVSNGAQLASYPTILLLTTLYRLALEISSTRLILLQADAGDVIKAFGEFVVGGNFVVGAVIFLIITLVQFLVITKGSERVAEVAARFTLDAMPGKQMSIDADLRSGSIDFKVARKRRQALAKESQFYGAMDGAMKFVKGDAIAGIIITVINIVGGLIIGVAMNGMRASEAVQTYSILTIGDGLVSQIPALLISISAGLVVTRVASEDEDTNLGSDIAGQILAQPKAIGIASVILLILGLVPGMPKLAFLLLASVTGSISYGLYQATGLKKQAKDQETEKLKQIVPPPSSDPSITRTVPLIMELGKELVPYVSYETAAGKEYFRKLVELRDTLYRQLGVVYPALRVNLEMLAFEGNNNYRFWLQESPIANGRIISDRLLVNASAQQLSQYGVQAEATMNPADFKPAAWISRADKARVASLQVKIWETDDVLLLQTSRFLRAHAMDFISVQEVQWMINETRKLYPALVDEIIPKTIGMQQLTDVLKRLLSEEVSIRDLKVILQAIGEWYRIDGGNTVELVEHVRAAMRRRICFGLSGGKARLLVYQLDPGIEDMLRDAIRQGPAGPFLAIEYDQRTKLIQTLREQIADVSTRTQSPVLLVDSSVRRYIKVAVGEDFPELRAISYNEIAPEVEVEPIGTITFAPTVAVDEQQLSLQ